MKNIFVSIIIGLIMGFILSYFIFAKIKPSIRNHYIDTTITINIPETTYVDCLDVRWEKWIVDLTDTNRIKELEYNLAHKDSFIKALLDSLNKGKSLIVEGGEKFKTGDSIYTTAGFFPLSFIEHKFY